MCYVELEPCEVWDVTTHKARKEHVCGTCQRRIMTGETYTATFSIFEGDAAYGKTCRECNADIAAFGAAHDGMTCHGADFLHILEECIADGDEESERTWKPMLAAIKARAAA